MQTKIKLTVMDLVNRIIKQYITLTSKDIGGSLC